MQEDSDVEEKEGEEVPTAGVPWEVLVECLTSGVRKSLVPEFTTVQVLHEIPKIHIRSWYLPFKIVMMQGLNARGFELDKVLIGFRETEKANRLKINTLSSQVTRNQLSHWCPCKILMFFCPSGVWMSHRTWYHEQLSQDPWHGPT